MNLRVSYRRGGVGESPLHGYILFGVNISDRSLHLYSGALMAVLLQKIPFLSTSARGIVPSLIAFPQVGC